MNLIKCRFLDENKNPKNREYIYASLDELAVGEIVSTQDGKEVVVTATDVSQDTIEGFKDKVKYVSRPQPEPGELLMDEIADTADISTEADAEAEVVFELPEISVSKENLAIVEQLPIITEQLKVFSEEIDSITTIVGSMECTENNRQIVKKYRQRINALLAEFEKRRIAIKNEILAPYETFNNDYKIYVSDKINKALSVLDSNIIAIEKDIKQRLQDDAEGYFYEYLAGKNIDWLTWEKSGIKIGLTDNKTALRREVKAFIDKVADDLAIIETQEHSSEIIIEYCKELNAMKAITTVQARVKAVAERERIRAEQEERRKAAEEQRRLQAEALEKARSEQKPVAIEPPKREQTPAAPPKVEQPIAQSAEAKKYTIAFKINNETPERLALVKKFLVDNGFEYVQVPIKNIREAV